ncbi:GatB/YqeY domain-containing protein [Thioalbus denitrificans]|uniref:Glutamyl-tRNA amidotransferase n=1 Tax=Thioalbus denitrificans TaxID=547122 RepID=A0A369CI89_9GAMM|nr:GatB/YqeY domain-containing protein [Thioalbus denitrificans]RCX32998.1 hypothetical protein DFQ59_101297 [Thioalbus denitrificans]
MSDSLKQRIDADMKAAMRAKDRERLGTVRLILAAIKQREVDERTTLDDTQVLAVLDKMAKQRRDSIAQYEGAGRQDLADKEQRELEIIQDYMPQPLSAAEIAALIDAAVASTGAGGMQDMGKVMGVLRPQVQGRADMGAVSAAVKARLG